MQYKFTHLFTMRISTQNRQLIHIAGGINLLFFLLCVIFLFYLGRDYAGNADVVRKILKFTFANSLCWIINLALLLIPARHSRHPILNRLLTFYLPSYLITFAIGSIIAISPLYTKLAEDHSDHPISETAFFVLGVNTLSLVAIELILSRAAQASYRIQYANIQAENAQLQMRSLEAQHEKLKNQLHPHFLFNSLSALKSLVHRDPELAEQYIVKLSGFLRFSMAHNEQNIVPLHEELKFSIDYLEMQKIRFRSALQYSTDIPPDRLVNAYLPVFSLQLVLENAIKHNRLTAETPLCISVTHLSSGWLRIDNNIQSKLSADPASGIGLKNLSDRYKLLAQNDIRIENDSETFSVYLKIIQS